MNLTATRHTVQDLPDSMFSARTSFGPLSPLEECLRQVAQLGFHALIACDSAMCTGRLTHAGERWLLPVIHQSLGHRQPLPVTVPDWITLYHRARQHSLEHFASWNAANPTTCSRIAINSSQAEGVGHWC